MHDFRTLARILEERGEIYRISRPVDRRFEMAAVMEQVERQRRAYLFENVRDADCQAIGGLLNRLECYGWALGSTPGQPLPSARSWSPSLSASKKQVPHAHAPSRTPAASGRRP